MAEAGERYVGRDAEPVDVPIGGVLDQATMDALYVNVDGDTMTGPLILADDATVPLGVATKRVADTRVADTGGTMTGMLMIHGPMPQLRVNSSDEISAIHMVVPGWGARVESRGGQGFYFVNDNGGGSRLHAWGYNTTTVAGSQFPTNADGLTDLVKAVTVLVDAVSGLPGGPEALRAALEGGS